MSMGAPPYIGLTVYLLYSDFIEGLGPPTPQPPSYMGLRVYLLYSDFIVGLGPPLYLFIVLCLYSGPGTAWDPPPPLYGTDSLFTVQCLYSGPGSPPPPTIWDWQSIHCTLPSPTEAVQTVVTTCSTGHYFWLSGAMEELVAQQQNYSLRKTHHILSYSIGF